MEQKLSSIWWTQIHTIVEVKPKRPQKVGELHETIVQLCSYIRQVFREQFDRRFVIALLFCGDGLTLWYCDRVGLVGTIDPINIHDVSAFYRCGETFPFITVTETRRVLKDPCCVLNITSPQTRVGSHDEGVPEK